MGMRKFLLEISSQKLMERRECFIIISNQKKIFSWRVWNHILQNKELDYEERIKILRELIVKDIGQFTTRYDFSKENSITDNSYRLWELIHYIGKFIDVYSEFIIEGIENKKIENNMGISRENVRNFAAFILYGAVGTIYNDYIIKGENKTNSSEAFGIISELFHRPH